MLSARPRGSRVPNAQQALEKYTAEQVRERYTCTPVTATLVSEYGLKDTGSEYTPTDTAS